MQLEELAEHANALHAQIGSVVQGQHDVVKMMLVALFSQGHVLLEGPPGTAKTLLAKSFAASLALNFGRVQFTPDLMPGDVLGTSIFDFQTGQFRLTRGPVFTDVLLSDEINRAPPKSQAALLQAMNEREVTLDGSDYDLGQDFFVIATQNPIEQQGTYPLPEAQLDRFLFNIMLDFPSEAIELSILRAHADRSLTHGDGSDALYPVLTREQLSAARQLVDTIRLEDDILAYILRIVRATRSSPDIAHGASTRAADALAAAVRAEAALSGRSFALPDDVKLLALPTLRHRIVLAASAEIEGRGADSVLTNLIERIEVPR